MIGEYLKNAARSLLRKRGRSALNLLGVAIGVASVVLVGNISQTGGESISNELDSLGLGGLTISSQDTTLNPLTDLSLQAVESDPQVSEAMPLLMQVSVLSAREEESQAVVWGVGERADKIISIEALYGRFFSKYDVRTSANVCLVDEAFSQRSYGRSNIVGKEVYLSLNGTSRPYTVIGVVQTGSGMLQGAMGSYVPTFVYLPYTTMQQTLGRTDFDQIAVKIDAAADAETTGATLIRRLDRMFGSGAEVFKSNDLSQQRSILTKILDTITLILTAIGGISLAVASLSIMTMMLVSVSERKREIGIKKAIGARSGAILMEFLTEAFLISGIGSAIGVVLGCIITQAGAALLGFSASIQLSTILFATLFAIAASVVFSVYPAYKAAKLDPVAALRSE